jgi:hypothetical protein
VVDVDRHQAAEATRDAVGDEDGIGLGRARFLRHRLERSLLTETTLGAETHRSECEYVLPLWRTGRTTEHCHSL